MNHFSPIVKIWRKRMSTNIQLAMLEPSWKKKKKRERSGMSNPKQITHQCPALQNGQNNETKK